MEAINIYKRLTHRYVGGWEHLDKHEFVGMLKLTPSVKTKPAGEIDEGPTYVQFCRVPASIAIEDAVRALIDTRSSHGCDCEHDCCGCASYYVDVAVQKRRTLRVTTSVSYNY